MEYRRINFPISYLLILYNKEMKTMWLLILQVETSRGYLIFFLYIDSTFIFYTCIIYTFESSFWQHMMN